MRFLFTTVPGTSHLLPLVPFAHAALAAGHDVRVASSGPALSVAAGAGLHALEVDDGASARPYAQMVETVGRTNLTRERTQDELNTYFAQVFGETGALLLGGLTEAIREWRADAVVYTAPAVGGLAAARATGIPAILHGLGTRRPTFAPAYAHLRTLVPELELPERAEADIEIDLSPASLETIHQDVPQESRAGHTFRMRYVPNHGGAQLPGWVREPVRRRRILVTLGSLSETYRDGRLMRHIIDAAADLAVDVVLTTGDAVLPDPLPEHVRAVPWLPLRAVMDTCAAVVHHGGMGTMYAAFDAGVPQLAIPVHGTDSVANAKIAVARGAALELDAGTISGAAIADALRKLLDSDLYRVASGEVAREMREMPAPNTVIDRVTAALAGDR